jgi:hypothetical protein
VCSCCISTDSSKRHRCKANRDKASNTVFSPRHFKNAHAYRRAEREYPKAYQFARGEELHGSIRHLISGAPGRDNLSAYEWCTQIKMTLTRKKALALCVLFTRLCTTALQNDDLEMVMADIGTAYLNAECSAGLFRTVLAFLRNKGAGPRGTTSVTNYATPNANAELRLLIHVTSRTNPGPDTGQTHISNRPLANLPEQPQVGVCACAFDPLRHFPRTLTFGCILGID